MTLCCPVCSGLGYVHVHTVGIAIDACPRCTTLGEMLWRDHLREVEAAKLLSRKAPVAKAERRAA